MSYYKYHIFFCCNQRDSGRECCNDFGARKIRDYAKKKVKTLGLAGRDKTRVNISGCLDRCSEGPFLVVYPDNIWYRYVDESDVDEIIESHIQRGNVVERLLI